MNLKRRYSLVLAKGLLLAICIPSFFMGASSPQEGQRFRVFDGTLYQNKPSSGVGEMEHLKILYAGSIWGKNLLLNEVPSEARIEQFLAEKVDLSDLIVLDLEQWDVTGSDAEASLSISKLAETQRLFRKHAPDRLFGFYGLLPIRNYHCPQKPPYNTCHGTWRYQNDRLAAFAKSTDALFPLSLIHI